MGDWVFHADDMAEESGEEGAATGSESVLEVGYSFGRSSS